MAPQSINPPANSSSEPQQIRSRQLPAKKDHSIIRTRIRKIFATRNGLLGMLAVVIGVIKESWPVISFMGDIEFLSKIGFWLWHALDNGWVRLAMYVVGVVLILRALYRNVPEASQAVNRETGGETEEDRIIELAVQELESRESPVIILRGQPIPMMSEQPQPHIEFQIARANKSSIWSVQPTDVDGWIMCDGSMILGLLQLMSKQRFPRSDEFNLIIRYFPSKEASEHIRQQTGEVTLDLSGVKIHFVRNPEGAHGHVIGSSVAVPISLSFNIRG